MMMMVVVVVVMTIMNDCASPVRSSRLSEQRTAPSSPSLPIAAPSTESRSPPAAPAHRTEG